MDITAQYIGVDYSTRKLAVALLTDKGDITVISKELPRRKFPDRMQTMIELHYTLAEFLSDVDMQVSTSVAIEAPIMGMTRDVQTALWMSMTAGVLVMASIDSGCQPLLVAPSSWKKRVVGYGRADKARTKEWMDTDEPDLSLACANDDERDAVCLALYARSIDLEKDDDDQRTEAAEGS